MCQNSASEKVSDVTTLGVKLSIDLHRILIQHAFISMDSHKVHCKLYALVARTSQECSYDITNPALSYKTRKEGTLNIRKVSSYELAR